MKELHHSFQLINKNINLTWTTTDGECNPMWLMYVGEAVVWRTTLSTDSSLIRHITNDPIVFSLVHQAISKFIVLCLEK